MFKSLKSKASVLVAKPWFRYVMLGLMALGAFTAWYNA